MQNDDDDETADTKATQILIVVGIVAGVFVLFFVSALYTSWATVHSDRSSVDAYEMYSEHGYQFVATPVPAVATLLVQNKPKRRVIRKKRR
jgi:hypothetical protein